MPGRVRFFRSASAFRAWLEANHDVKDELWVGFHRKDSGRGGLTYAEALDQALCYGWIDGVRRTIDTSSYTNRFTPRRPRSRWSAMNVGRVKALEAHGLMAPPGRAAFARRVAPDPEEPDRSVPLPPPFVERFSRAAKAWQFFTEQPPGYQRLARLWVMSGRKPETRERRLATLIADSTGGRRIAPLRRVPSTSGTRRSG